MWHADFSVPIEFIRQRISVSSVSCLRKACGCCRCWHVVFTVLLLVYVYIRVCAVHVIVALHCECSLLHVMCLSMVYVHCTGTSLTKANRATTIRWKQKSHVE